MFQNVLGFLIILGPLVVFHEFGHYIFARLFNVKAEIFSVGFGPTLWKRQMGETELRLSAIPLGGYVKLLGEDREAEMSAAEQNRALHKQAPWKRFFIFFGGPLFNFIFAVFVFMAILVIGEPQMASVIGRVVHGSTAEKSGLKSGDRIIAIDGKPVSKFEEVIIRINESPNKELQFRVERPGAQINVPVTPTTQEGFSVYGESTHVGEIEGLLASARATHLGVSNRASAAGKAGLKTGDAVSAIDGKTVETWEALEAAYQALPAGQGFKLKVLREPSGKADPIPVEVALKRGASGDLGKDLGLFSSELFVQKTVGDAPAEKAGVKAGDRLVSVSGHPVQSFFDLRDAVQRAGEKDGMVPLQWERDGKLLSANIRPTATTSRDPLLKKVTQYTVGVAPMLVLAEPAVTIERVWNPFTLMYRATERMFVLSWRNLVSIQKMFAGDVSVKTLGGPIMIGKIAGDSLSRGLIAFLTTMGILSIGLGVLNILPVPVLDGGHLLLLGIEMIRGKPLSLRQMEIVQGVGLVFILGLMGVVLKNDFARLPFFD
jgi:regulator of sigma E protease